MLYIKFYVETYFETSIVYSLICLLFHISVVQALDTLGSTKWRVNKRVLGVIDRIWASGGRLADLVDRDDVGIPAVILILFFCFFFL